MKLIALAIIAAGLVALDSPEIAEGSAFDAESPFADKLIAEGLAKEAEADPKAQAKAPAKKAEKTIKARLLRDCAYGQADQVVSLPAAEAKQAQEHGFVDTHPDAVAYAESLVA